MQTAFEGLHKCSHQSATKFHLGSRLQGHPKLTQDQPFLCINHIHPDLHVAADLDWLGQPLPVTKLAVLLACRGQPGAFAFRRTSLHCYPSLAHIASCVSSASWYAELRFRAPQRSYLPLSDQQYCLRCNCNHTLPPFLSKHGKVCRCT